MILVTVSQHIIFFISETAEVDEVMDTSEAGSCGQDTGEKDELAWLLGELLDKYVHQTQPSVRQVGELHLSRDDHIGSTV